MDENNLAIPQFLAPDHSSMPPASGYEIISDHLVAFLSEVGDLRQKVESLTEVIATIKNHNITEVKEDLYDIKNILLQKSTISSEKSVKSYSSALTDCPSTSEVKNKVSGIRAGQLHPNNGPTNQSRRKSSSTSRGSGSRSNLTGRSGAHGASLSGRSADSSGSGKRKDVVTGQRKSTASIKGVSKTLDIYVGRCHSSTDSDSIKHYILTESEVKVIDCEIVSTADSITKAFKVTVSASDRDKLLDADLWPENICIRNFFNFKRNGRSRTNK